MPEVLEEEEQPEEEEEEEVLPSNGKRRGGRLGKTRSGRVYKEFETTNNTKDGTASSKESRKHRKVCRLFKLYL